MQSLGFEIGFETMATRFHYTKHFDLLPVDLLWMSAETFSKMVTNDQRTGEHAEMPMIDLESLPAVKRYALNDDQEREGRDLHDTRLLL